jgi:hypothetical protein
MAASTFNRTPISSLEFPRFQSIGAGLFLLGVFATFFGLGWDVQWHNDVGPDTFWTLPHSMTYFGAALSGFACLTVVLISSFASRETRSLPGMIPILGGMFYAPVGFVVGGFGAAGFLSFGLFDQYWHSLFGFDVTVSSPPHMGLLFSFIMAVVGCVLVFIQGRETKTAAFVVATALALGFTLPFVQMNFSEFNLEIPMFLFPTLLLPLGMLFVASVTRKPWMLFVMTLVFGAFRYLCWFVFPEITSGYASFLGLALRDQPSGIPTIPYLMPMLLPLAGLISSGILVFAKSRGWRVIPSVLLAGGLAAPFFYIDLLLWQFVQAFPIGLIGVALLGAVGAWLGWQLGVVARHANRELEQVQGVQS